MENVADPVAFFEALGGLHDAKLEWISWDAPDELRLVLDNLNSNFMDGLVPSPDYPGYVARPATIVFCGVRDFTGHLREGASHISEIRLARSDGNFDVQVIGNDTWVFLFTCEGLAIEEAQEPSSVSIRYQRLTAQT